MSMSTGGSGRRGRRSFVADINITPLVDVMLVLLIIFMVTAPMMTQGLNVDLPKVTGKALEQEETPLTITLQQDGTVSINKIPLTPAMMKTELEKKYKENSNQTLYLNAAQGVPYGRVVELMADIRAVGFEKLGMVTAPPEKKE